MEQSSGASSEQLRIHNRRLVLQHIFVNGPTSRAEIAAQTNLTGAAITRITRELLDDGLLREGAQITHAGRPGRRSIELDLHDSGTYVLGFGAGAYEQWLQLSNLRGRPLDREQLHLMRTGDPDIAISVVIAAALRLLERNHIERSRVLGFGAAVAGVVDSSSGRVLQSPNLGWRDVDFGPTVAKALGLPVKVESLHHALNMAECGSGVTRGLSNVALLNLALGIGGSFLIDNRILRGSGTAAGQLGHMRVPGGTELCTCGRRGCLDTVASGHAVLRTLGRIEARTKAGPHDPREAQLLLDAMKAADAGEPGPGNAFFTAGQHIGAALDAIWTIASPKRVVLAGPLAQIKQYVDGIHGVLDSERWNAAPEDVLLVSRKSNDAAGVWLALDEFVLHKAALPVTP